MRFTSLTVCVVRNAHYTPENMLSTVENECAVRIRTAHARPGRKQIGLFKGELDVSLSVLTSGATHWKRTSTMECCIRASNGQWSERGVHIIKVRQPALRGSRLGRCFAFVRNTLGKLEKYLGQTFKPKSMQHLVMMLLSP